MVDQDEAAEALKQLRTIVAVSSCFKSVFLEYKAESFESCPLNPWRVQVNTIFSELDSFLDRCDDTIDFVQTVIHFSKLPRIEIGSTKGRTLTDAVHAIYADLNAAILHIKSQAHNVMDAEMKEIDHDFSTFQATVREVERKLASAISTGLDDCNSVYGRFQLLDSFDVDLLNRSTMRDEMEGRYISLFKEYVDDLQVVREIFLGFKDNPPQDTTRYLPPFAAKLTWCRSLLARIQLPMQKFQQLDNEILDREEAKEAQKVQTYLISSLQTYETNSVNEWSVSVEQVSVQKLCLPLLERNTSTRHIMTNFDPALVWMLREVKYLTQLQVSVPPAALEVFQSCETFRRWVGNLDIIVNLYNFVLNELLPVEKPLIAPYLMKVDKCIRVGVEDMNWKSVGIDTFITNALDNVRSMHDILMIMKNNLSSIEELCRSWNTALIDRRVKPEDKGEFERSAKALRNMRFSSIKESGKQIHNLLKETNRILRVSNSAPDWRYYVDFVSNIVIDGLSSAVVMSLAFLLQQVSPSLIQSTGRLPLLDVKLDFDLETMSLKFDPDLDHHSGEGIADMFDNIIGSFIQVGSLFKRLDTDGTYTREILSNITINGYLSKLSDAFFENKQLFSVFKQAFEEYSNLWSSEFPSQFSSFLANATKVTSYGIVALDIGLFDRAINYLKDIQDSISKVKSSSDIGFLRIDVTPAKHQISLLVMKSINKYTKFMLENVLTSLSDLNLFMDNAGKTLALTNIEGGCRGKSLMDIMAIIRDVRKKMETFEDNRRLQLDCVQALRRYGVDLNNAVISGQCLNDFLEELPLRWEALIKKTFKTKEDILPFQIESINSLKIDVENFYYSVRAFRGDFRANAPFKFSGTGSQAYQILGTYADALDNLELEVTRFNELEDLFELQESSFCEIGETRSEIKILKHLWDFKAMVDLIYAGWRTMLWKDVNVDTLDDQNKKLRKQLKDYGNSFPSMKGWQVYRDIDDLTTVFSISLPLINELHSDAIRPRHWSALARICNVKAIEPSQKTFSLSDMMNLNLHKFSESIEEIVETAAKEVKIERKLAEINHLWSSIELDYVFHKDSDLLLPNPSDDVVENMEAHQMELQGIFAMGKFMEFFRDDVVNWQSRLRLLDDTLRMWVQVARTWVSLEAIFLASVDIRSQLPEDTKRFDGIDSDFKELMKEATLEKNCLNSCTVNGRYAALKGMRDRLELCQKSLNEYLDIKKKIFPRFYFVSSSALLDMVANGRSPTKIVPYLGDCYDALAGLSFTKDSHGIQSDKIVETMIAKDGETVPLCAPFIMDGEVEHYLNRLTGVMQQSLKVILSDAMEKAASWEVDIPRQEWIFHYPAQLCITGTQIYWTDETQQALEEYEGGQEDAVKRYLQMCNYRLSSLIQLVLGKLSAADRTKIISLITMDVHSRDVVDRLISSKTEGPTAFTWQQQLRFEWDPPKMDVNVKICDFSCKYFYEWVGNTGRLVITPLTDRCYITLTMALKLFLGGAPAGPAGTGKVCDIMTFCQFSSIYVNDV
jgi:dynein heavy chain